MTNDARWISRARPMARTEASATREFPSTGAHFIGLVLLRRINIGTRPVIDQWATTAQILSLFGRVHQDSLISANQK